ncbi:nucleotidyltransferase family protein [Erwinia oleae]|uniref:nucleotidyltransferase family protein n=1 Tax=Erwinia oleae TaxID=796334 RepID=UPI0005575508|nr:nucleotidyltransferase family protein [Erwinia oleae]
MSGQSELTLFRELYDAYFYNETFKNTRGIDISFLNQHKLLPLLNYVIHQQNLYKEVGYKDCELIASYCSHLEKKQSFADKELDTLAKMMKQEKIHYALRKGKSLAALYHHPSHRTSNDVDLLVDVTSADDLKSLLAAAGFTCGFYHHQTRAVHAHKPETLLKYRMSPDHLPHYVKIVDGIPIVIDIAFTLSWTTKQDKISTEEILRKATEVNGISFLEPFYNYLHTLLHLYRECVFLTSLQKRPPYLTSVIDVMLLNRLNSDVDNVDNETHALCELITQLCSALCEGEMDLDSIARQHSFIEHKGKLIKTNGSFVNLMFTSHKNYKEEFNSITLDR